VTVARDRDVRLDTDSARVFVGVFAPAEVGSAIDGAIAPWRERFPSARWVPSVDRHLTLKFLGTTSAEIIDEVHQRVGDVAAIAAPFRVRLAGLGAFPSSRRARVLWIGVGEGGSGFSSLARSLDDALAPWFPAQNLPFVPHLTVARSSKPLHLPADYATSPGVREAFAVEEVILLRSRRGRSVPRYEPLARFTLGE
jgi:RNA 2',3'-cyclic 3'-phosphodiesterase